MKKNFKDGLIKTKEMVEKILADIKFSKSCVNMGWQWEVKELQEGFLIRCSFQRPDVYKDGEIGTGFGRWWFIDKDTKKTGIVMTAWMASNQIVVHEMMEAFEYQGVKILNPHKNLRQLAYPKELP